MRDYFTNGPRTSSLANTILLHFSIVFYSIYTHFQDMMKEGLIGRISQVYNVTVILLFQEIVQQFGIFHFICSIELLEGKLHFIVHVRL